MIQLVLVVVLFAAAAFFIGRKLYRSYKGEDHQCGDCAVNEMKKGVRS